MGRALREIAIATYHVFSRCRNNLDLMKDDRIKDLMLTIIKETQELFDFELNSFEILDNHFHFVITTTNNEHSISKIMQRIKSVFAKRYNRLHGIKGPFWNERFGSKIIEEAVNIIQYMLHLLWYIAYNPVKKGVVDNPRRYKYGTINSYLHENHKPPIKITLHKFFFTLGKTFKERVQIFKEYEEAYISFLFSQ